VTRIKRWFSVGYFGYADKLLGLRIEQANLDLKAGTLIQGFKLRHIKAKSVGNQAESFMELARQSMTGEVKGDWIPVAKVMMSF